MSRSRQAANAAAASMPGAAPALGVTPPVVALIPPEVLVPLVILGLILGAGIVGHYVQWRRQQRVDSAFDHLVNDARFQPIEDESRRRELGRHALEVLTGEQVPGQTAVPLAHAASYPTDGLTLNVLHLGPSRHTAGVAEPDALVLICDRFDVTLPEFRLLPANMLLRQTLGQGIYDPDTPFGRYNLVFSREPERTRHVLDDEAQTLLARNDSVAIECTPEHLSLYRHDHKGQAESLIPLVEDCLTLAQIIRDNARTMPEQQHG